MKNRWQEEIKKGDLIVVGYGHSQWPGFYVGRGEGSSIQYYGILNLLWWLDRLEKNPNSTIRKTYIMGNPNRVFKVSPDYFNEEWTEKYEKALHALGKLKVI